MGVVDQETEKGLLQPPIEDGKTTKEEILLRFGLPSTQFQGERILSYRLRRVSSPRITGVVARESDRSDPRFATWYYSRFNLILVFDERGLLKRHSLLRMRWLF